MSWEHHDVPTARSEERRLPLLYETSPAAFAEKGLSQLFLSLNTRPNCSKRARASSQQRGGSPQTRPLGSKALTRHSIHSHSKSYSLLQASSILFKNSVCGNDLESATAPPPTNSERTNAPSKVPNQRNPSPLALRHELHGTFDLCKIFRLAGDSSDLQRERLELRQSLRGAEDRDDGSQILAVESVRPGMEGCRDEEDGDFALRGRRDVDQVGAGLEEGAKSVLDECVEAEVEMREIGGDGEEGGKERTGGEVEAAVLVGVPEAQVEGGDGGLEDGGEEVGWKGPVTAFEVKVREEEVKIESEREVDVGKDSRNDEAK